MGAHVTDRRGLAGCGAAATAAGPLTSRASPLLSKRRRISVATSRSPRANALVRAMDSRGRLSPGSFGLEQPQGALGTLGRPSSDDPPVSHAERLRRSHDTMPSPAAAQWLSSPCIATLRPASPRFPCEKKGRSQPALLMGLRDRSTPLEAMAVALALGVGICSPSGRGGDETAAVSGMLASQTVNGPSPCSPGPVRRWAKF